MMKGMASSSSITTIGDNSQMEHTALDENRFPTTHALMKSWVLPAKNPHVSTLSTSLNKILLNFSGKSSTVLTKKSYTSLATSTHIKLLFSTSNSRGAKIGLTAKLIKR